MANNKSSFWLFSVKIFFITLFLSASISVVSQYLTMQISLYFALLVLLIIVLFGVVFDIIGVAFSTCDSVPFVSLAAKRNKAAKQALKLLRNAASVASFCNDVIGDICGIVSGAAGAVIVTKLIVDNPTYNEIAWTIAVSAIIAAVTVALKALGKHFAMVHSKKIVSGISYFLSLFRRA